MKFRIILAVILMILLPVNISWAIKECPRYIDKWYRIDQDWRIRAPDKFQHAFFFYVGQRVGDHYVGQVPTIIAINGLGIIKELMIDSEGFSFRDISCNMWGCLGGMLEDSRSRLTALCTWEENSVLFLVRIKLE